jgi:hypothetical protein
MTLTSIFIGSLFILVPFFGAIFLQALGDVIAASRKHRLWLAFEALEAHDATPWTPQWQKQRGKLLRQLDRASRKAACVSIGAGRYRANRPIR